MNVMVIPPLPSLLSMWMGFAIMVLGSKGKL